MTRSSADIPEPADQRRSASATLRAEQTPVDLSPSLDPAQRSLAEALRISYFLLQVGMLALIVLFLLSGARQVRESERGIRLTFGKVAEQDVPPGLHFSWPFPVGEFLTVQTGLVSIELDTSFWPKLTERQRALSLDSLGNLTNLGLRPGDDGSLITGDNNIVHTQWRVEYHRAAPVEFIRNVHTPDEERLVRAAVERAIVLTVAELPIDALLRQGFTTSAPAATPQTPAPAEAPAESPPAETPAADAPPPATPAAAPTPSAPAPAAESAVSARVRRLAQETLDAMESGIRLGHVILKQTTPPLPVRSTFQQVQSAIAQSQKAREEALRESRATLNSVAGLAHPHILNRLDAYEKAVEAGDNPRAAEILTTIHALLEGQPVEIDGQRIDRLVSGEVTDIINRARQYRTQVVANARSDAETFRAKLEQYRANPAVLLTREWTDAYNDMLALPAVQVLLVPPATGAELWINPDPDYLKELEAERNKAQLQQNLTTRQREFERDRREFNRSNPAPRP